MLTDTCSPGGHPHSDMPNFTIDDYLQMCRDGEARFSMSEAARVAGVSRAELYRWIALASIPESEFEDVLDNVVRKRGLTSTTAVADEIKRRTGKAKEHHECCPHCGGVLRTRNR